MRFLELAKFVVKHDKPWQVNSDIFVMLGNDYIEQMYQDVIEAIEYLTKSGYNMKKFSFQFLRPCSSCTDGCQAGQEAVKHPYRWKHLSVPDLRGRSDRKYHDL